MTPNRAPVWIVAVIIALSVHAAQGQEKPHLAVLDLESSDVEAGQVSGISEILREAFVASGRFVVVDRTLTRKILDEWALQQSGAVDETKAIEVGKLLNVRYIVTGRLTRLGEEGWQVSVVLLDAESGVTRSAKVLHHKGGYYALVKDKMPPLATTLAKLDLREAPAPLAVKRPDRDTRKNAEALYEKGAAHWDGERYDPPEKAIAYFSQAIELDPGLVDAYNDRGNVYLENEDFQEAIADFNQAIRLNPRLADAYYSRGLAYAELEQYAKAIADFDEAIRINPDHSDAWFDRGDTRLEMKEPESAVTDFSKAIGLDPENADAYYGRGNAYDELGRTRLAIADYEKAVSLDPEMVDALYDLGLLLFEEGERERACGYWRKACSQGSETACRRVKGKC